MTLELMWKFILSYASLSGRRTFRRYLSFLISKTGMIMGPRESYACKCTQEF